MAETTNISWCDHTWSPWYGCTQVSMGPHGACEGCYARQMSETRFGRVVFGGPGRGEGTRDVRADAAWREPLRWAPGSFVFPSMCDPFDNHPDLVAPRRRFFDLIRATPHLTWLLLTKRPGNIVKLFRDTIRYEEAVDPALSFYWPCNAAIGCTVVCQDEAVRDVPKLLDAKYLLNPAFAFLSMEPLLGPVDLTRLDVGGHLMNALTGAHWHYRDLTPIWGPAIDWVITGGETDQGAHKARPSHPDWFRSIRDQCIPAGVAFHHKQHGEWAPICWMDDGLSDRLYHPAPKRDPEAIRRCKVEHTVMNSDGSLHPDVADRETYRPQDRSMLMFKTGNGRSGRLIDGVRYDARPQVPA